MNVQPVPEGPVAPQLVPANNTLMAMNPEIVGHALSDSHMGHGDVANLLNSMNDAASFGHVLNHMDPDKAGDVLTDMTKSDLTNAYNVLGNMDLDKAGHALTHMNPDSASNLLSVDAVKAGKILSSIDPHDRGTLLGQMTPIQRGPIIGSKLSVINQSNSLNKVNEFKDFGEL